MIVSQTTSIGALTSICAATLIGGSPRNVPRETAGVEHRHAASSVGAMAPPLLPLCVLACRRRRPAVSRATSRADPLADDREPALGGQRVEGVLHDADDVLVDLVDVGLGAELLAQVDQRERLDRDLG